MENKRNYGLDIYRLLAMLMITILHVNVPLLNLIGWYNGKGVRFSGWVLQTICFCGVNCFAILTGYLSRPGQEHYDLKWFQKLFDFWGKTVLFCVILYFPLIWIFPQISFNSKMFSSFFYVGDLWYVGAYLGLLLFLPILSGIMSRFSIREQIIFFIVSFFLLCVLQTINYATPFFRMSKGYSAIWLMICFCWGQVLQSIAPRILKWKHHTSVLVTGAAAGFIVPLLMFYFGENIGFIRNILSKMELSSDFLIDYLSPFCVLEAVCLLLLFSKIRIENPKIQKFITFLSVYSFGIYLIQCHPVVWNEFIVRKNHVPQSALQITWKFMAVTLGLYVAGIVFYFLISKLYQLIRFSNVGKTCFQLMEKCLLKSDSELK